MSSLGRSMNSKRGNFFKGGGGGGGGGEATT